MSRFEYGMSDGGPNHNQHSRRPRRAPGRPRGGTTLGAAAGLPDIYIAMGQTAENVAEFENVSRDEMDEFAGLAAARGRVARERLLRAEITPVTLPTARSSEGRRSAPRTTVEGLRRSSRCSARRQGHRRQRLPLNDGAAAVVVMSDTKAQALGITPLARIVASA